MTTRTELGAWVDKLLPLDSGNALPLLMRAARLGERSFEEPGDWGLPGAAFTVSGATPATSLAFVIAGVELQLANNVSIGAKFDNEFVSVSQTNAGTVTVRYIW